MPKACDRLSQMSVSAQLCRASRPLFSIRGADYAGMGAGTLATSTFMALVSSDCRTQSEFGACLHYHRDLDLCSFPNPNAQIFVYVSTVCLYPTTCSKPCHTTA